MSIASNLRNELDRAGLSVATVAAQIQAEPSSVRKIPVRQDKAVRSRSHASGAVPGRDAGDPEIRTVPAVIRQADHGRRGEGYGDRPAVPADRTAARHLALRDGVQAARVDAVHLRI